MSIHTFIDDPKNESVAAWVAAFSEFLDEVSDVRGLMATLTINETRGRLHAFVYVQSLRQDPVSRMVTPVSAPRAEVEKSLASLRSRKSRVIDPA